MANKTLLSLATIAFFATTAGAYEVESTNYWFTAAMDVNGEGWGKPSGVATNIIAGGIAVDTAADDPLIYSQTTSADGYRVKGTFKLYANGSAPVSVHLYDSKAPLGALTAYNGKWYGVDNNAWVEICNADAVTPADGNIYDVTIDFKTNGVSHYVRYSVRSEGIGSYQVLTNSSNASGWFVRGRNDNVAKVGFAGYGELSSLSADTVSYFEITATTEQLAAAGITGAVTEAVLNENGDNGLPKWQSLVLGLKANDSSSKPFVAPVQTADSDMIGFTIGNVTSASKFGATVKFDVIELATPTATTGDVKASNVDAGTTASFEPSAGVKYYKIKIKITK